MKYPPLLRVTLHVQEKDILRSCVTAPWSNMKIEKWQGLNNLGTCQLCSILSPSSSLLSVEAAWSHS